MYKNNNTLQLNDIISCMQGCFNIWKINVIYPINGLKEVNHVIILIDTEEIAFNKIQHSITIKNAEQARSRGRISPNRWRTSTQTYN